MDWLVAIDIKAWESNFLMLERILSYAKAKSWLSILYSKNIDYILSTNHSNSWLLHSILSGVNIVPYDKRPVGVDVSTNPNILVDLDDIEEDEVKDAAYFILSQEEPPHKLYTIYDLGSSHENLTLTSGTNSKDIPLIVESQRGNIQQYFDQNKPKLEQAKHIAQQSRNLGKGKIASTFKAWNQRDETYAKELLQKAFDNSGSQFFQPSPIYIWDSKNKVYVRFMHSGNWEYHGHDVENYDEVPDVIKRRYNHWKK